MNMYEYISNVLNIGMMTAITGAIGWRRKQRTQRGGSGGGSSGGGGSGINVTERGQRRQQRGRPRGPVAVLRLRAPAHDRPGHRADRVLVPVRAADGTSERLRPSGLHRSRWSHRRHRPPRCLRARLPVRRSESLPEPRHGQHRLLLLPGKSPSSVLLINYGAVPSTAPPLPPHRLPPPLNRRLGWKFDIQWPRRRPLVDGSLHPAGRRRNRIVYHFVGMFSVPADFHPHGRRYTHHFFLPKCRIYFFVFSCSFGVFVPSHLI